MTKVKITVLNKDTEADITENTEISVYNQNLKKEIKRRSDGYYYCNGETLYTITVTTDGTHIYSYDLYILYDTEDVIEKVFEVAE